MTHSRLKLPAPGTAAPDFTLPSIDGGTVLLSSAPKPVALVFLRHLA
jgi:hypothetical protein